MSAISLELGKKFFSGVQYSFGRDGKILTSRAEGRCSFESDEKISAATLFDLASLTKAIFTVPLFYRLFDKKTVNPDDLITDFLPDLSRGVSVLDLIRHCSGYPWYLPFYAKLKTVSTYEVRKKAVIRSITGIDEVCPPVYSDINYILLGFILEKIYGARLDQIFGAFLGELGFYSEMRFAIAPIDTHKCAATMFSKVRNKVCHGEVEDENCYFLGSASGHAGLFASADTVVKYLFRLMDEEWLHFWLRRLEGAGFDRPSGNDSTYGRKASPEFFGHLGFTGTALLFDPETKRAGVILTNRTHTDPDKENWRERMKVVRQELFDKHFGG